MLLWRKHRCHTHFPAAPHCPPHLHLHLGIRSSAARGRWLLKCPAAVAGLAPKVAAAGLVLTGANFEGLTPVLKSGRPQAFLVELSEHFGLPRAEIVQGMALLCNAYGGDA